MCYEWWFRKSEDGEAERGRNMKTLKEGWRYGVDLGEVERGEG